MTKPVLVVIGNGMAGRRLVDTLTQLAPHRFDIHLFGDEPQAHYNRIMLSPVLAGEKAFEDILSEPLNSGDNVTLYQHEPVKQIDRIGKTVMTANRTLKYDQLVLATGSQPVMPPLPGVTLSGIVGFRNQHDVETMLAHCRPQAQAVVIGGGVLGIEAAAGLQRRGMQVTILHRGPYLMDKQLDSRSSELLAISLRERGIQLVFNADTRRFLADKHEHVQAVELANDQRYPASLVVMSIGVRPEITLAKQVGLACQRGIVVSHELLSSDPSIFAIGECCQQGEITLGLLAPCWQHAQTLATHLAGLPALSSSEQQNPLRLKVSGIALFCAGEAQEIEGSEVHTTWDPLEQHYRRLVFRDGYLIGFQLFGDISDGAAFTAQLAPAQSVSTQPITTTHQAALALDSPMPWQVPTLSIFDPAGANNALRATIEQLSPLSATRRIAMSKPVLVVAGHGMVGHHFLQQLVERDLHQQYHVVVFGEEQAPAYDRVHLSEFFSGRSAESLSLVEDGFFEKTGIELRLGHEIVHIDRSKRYVVDKQGHQTPYDRLVLATGSYPFVPPIPGNDAPGCLVYRTLDDLASIKACAEQGRVGVVVGGGLLGLEAANALKHLGLQTHVVEFAPRLMGVQLDEGGAAMLRRKITALGVQVHTGKTTQEIVAGSEHRYAMKFSDGSELDTDLVLFSAGIRPRDQLARECGLDIGPRGGIVIDEQCRTSDADIYAIGECALWNGQIFGLVAPGYQMARTLADTLCGNDVAFRGADMSTKLKLLGVDVASLGDAHGNTPDSQSYSWIDGPAEVYKKIVVSADGKYLLGAVLVGDSSEYSTLLPMMLNQIPLPGQPEALILPASSAATPKGLGVAALPDSAQICSCHNVSKADICSAVQNGCGDMSAIKSCTKAATGCGGCAALTKQVMEFALAEQGVEVKKDICEHFPWSRQELYHLVRAGEIRSFEQLITQHGQGSGCEICKPLVGSILASCWNDYLLKPQHLPLQDTNDRYFANIQKDGTYSVVPRIPGGEITPDGLIAIGQVAKRYHLYTKITGGQRVDLFGARLEQLPEIWQQLVDAGFETGHAYGKSLRTVKSCVGSSWCRYGVQDSTTLAIELENRYKGLRSPHKIKMAVSGCTRECAEAQSKDVGVIATEKGWNLYICGNGGMKPRHADLLAQDLDRETLIRTIDRFLMFYIRTADRLQRTSSWMDNLEGGIDYLRNVVLLDSLHLGEQLENEMAQVVASYQCEWQTTLANADRLALFRPFINSTSGDENVVMVSERQQPRPATKLEREQHEIAHVSASPQAVDQEWVELCDLSAIPENAGMAARLGEQQIALFHLPSLPQKVFALGNHEPGSDAYVLARGMLGDVKGEPVVISPLYKQRFRLHDGISIDNASVRLACWKTDIRNGRVWVCQTASAQAQDSAAQIEAIGL